MSAYFYNYLEIFTDLAVCHASQNIVNKSSSKKVKKICFILNITDSVADASALFLEAGTGSGPHYGQNSEASEAKIEPWRSVDTNNGGLEAQMYGSIGRFIEQWSQIPITLMMNRIRNLILI